jgi:excisionase family DNA binding protein
MPEGTAVLTTTEARSLLRMGRNAFYTALREGRLPSFRVGRLYRFRREVLEEWIREQELGSQWRVPA